MELAYFRENPSHIQFHNADKERNAVTALYKHKEATQTVVLISHFDTVHTKDFGALEQYALQPKELIKQFKKIINQLQDKLIEITYIRENPSHIQFHNADKERNAVTALYKHKEATQTVVLISHFDTVHTKDFGALEQYALQPKELIKQFKKIIDQL